MDTSTARYQPGYIASLINGTHKNDKNKKEECETCKKLIELIFGPPTTVDHIEKLQEQKPLHEITAQLALPLISEHKLSESSVETWSTEEYMIPSHYTNTRDIPEPLMCQDLKHTERKTLEHLTKHKVILEPLHIEPIYEVLSVYAPKKEQGTDEFKIVAEAARSEPSTLGGSNPYKHSKFHAYKYAPKIPEPFLDVGGPERSNESENTGNITNELFEPGVINYEVQSVSAPPNNVQKQTEMQIIKGELATGTSIVPGESKTKKHFKCMIPAYADSNKIPEPFLYINGPECFPELINKEDFTDELIEPGVISHEVQSVCSPCKDVINLEKKMRTIKGVDRMSGLSALREQKPKSKHYKCMIPAYEDATKIPEPFLYINGPECFPELINKETFTDKQLETVTNTEETTVCADQTQQPEINMLKIKSDVVGLISAEESEPANSGHALKNSKRKYSKCIHEIQSVCRPSKDDMKLEMKLSKIKGVATRISQEESKPKKHFKCMITAYEHNPKTPEPFLYINGPEDEELQTIKRNNEKETKPGKITYEVQSVCAPDKSRIGPPLSVMWKKLKAQQECDHKSITLKKK